MLGRTPDTGAQLRDRMGPRSAVPLSVIEAIREAHRAGARPVDLAREHRLDVRTIYRYIGAECDPVAALVASVLADSPALFLGLTRSQHLDIGEEVARRLRMRGWI